MDLIACGIVLPWLVALGCWLGFQRLRLEAVEARLSQLSLTPATAKPPERQPEELPVGAAAPVRSG
jgi:hypothetical protein